MTQLYDPVETRLVDILSNGRGTSSSFSADARARALPSGEFLRSNLKGPLRDGGDPDKAFDRYYEVEWSGVEDTPATNNDYQSPQWRKLRLSLVVGYVYGDSAANMARVRSDETNADVVRNARKRALSDADRIKLALCNPDIFRDNGSLSESTDPTIYNVERVGESTIEDLTTGRLVCVTSYAIETEHTVAVLTISGMHSDGSTPIASSAVAFVSGGSGSTTTNGSGAWSLTAQPYADALVRATPSGYRAAQVNVSTAGGSVATGAVLTATNATLASYYSALGITENTSCGILIVVFELADGSFPGVSGFGATLSVTGGTKWVLDGGPTLASTTPSGNGQLNIANQPAGSVSLTFTGPAGYTFAPRSGTSTVTSTAQAITTVRVIATPP